jgi:predicted protein tyrosine phosphatase
MIEQRHRAYCDALERLASIARELRRSQEQLLAEAIADLFFTDDPTEALNAFAAADEHIASLAAAGELEPRAAKALLVAIAGIGPEPAATT